jgi:hypothetical protein
MTRSTGPPDRPGGPTTPAISVGIDLGTRFVHLVTVTPGAGPGSSCGATPERAAHPRVVDRDSFAATDLDRLVAYCATATTVAIDAPEELSRGAHLDDFTLPPKFRTARCCEIAAWKDHGQPPVPWVTPMTGEAVPAWMATGFAVWDALKAAGHRPLEVFPAGCFHGLNGGRWPPRKPRPAGRRVRLALLADLVGLPADATGWTHDTIDAAVLAVVAHQGRAAARPMSHVCPDGDGSVMWGLARPDSGPTPALGATPNPGPGGHPGGGAGS